MRNFRSIIIVLFISLLTFASQSEAYGGLHSYKGVSVLDKGSFVKIRIKESGVYKLTYEDLNAMGINPQKVKVYGYGGALLNQSFLQPKTDDLPELAIHMEKGADGVFNAGDYILFYAQGINSWSYDKNRAMYIHLLNHYSNYGYYFVGSGDNMRLIEEIDVSLPAGTAYNEVNEFVDYAVYEKELVSIANSGKDFYGETFSEKLSMNINFSFPNIITNTNAVKVRLDVAATSDKISTFQLKLNNQQAKSLPVAAKTQNDNYEKGRAANGIFTFTPEQSSLNFNLTYEKPSASSKGYLNYLEVNARRTLKVSGAAMQFQYPDFIDNDTYSKFNLTNAGAHVQIWDITDHVNVKRITAQADNNGNLSFFGNNKTAKTYLAIDPKAGASFPKPEVVGNVANQNLHGMLPTDMVIIAHPNFLQQAQRLAKAHNEMGEITVEAVTTEQVYNEFSSGTPDATAYRWMMKMLYDKATQSGDLTKRPKYLLLFGRGSFDNRKVLPSSSESYVLTYQTENSLVETLSYLTDDYFTFLEDSEGTQIPSHTMDIGIGRFPVSTVQEATDVVTKTINYMKNENRGIWKNQLCYLADDGDGFLHMEQADSVASMIGKAHPSMQITKIYLDAYQQEINASGETYPVARAQFHNLLRNGMFMLNFVGHAGATGWTNEQILSTADVRNLSNKNLPLWVAATCNFLQFDLPTVSAGEQVLLNPVGGGIGIISATRPVYASQNRYINQWINHFLFYKENGKNLRIGDVIARAKNNLGNEINKLSYVYMGDPAVRLNYPNEYRVITEKINDNPVQGNDTLKALSIAKFEGYIADKDGNLVNDFNGFLNAAVFDKVQRISSLKNHGETKTFNFNDRQNKLFSGVAEVVNGKFEITFMLPKDIKYNYGSGRVNFYASCNDNGYEAQGFFENFLIGGSNPGIDDNDNEGPEINMYLNTTDFRSGNKVNETPLFIAHVSDANGINQVGSGIGHDILLVIDEDPGKSYVLNDYYKSAMNDYSQGTIRFKLPELRSGKHTLTFRIWDLLNNSSTQTIDFEVVKGLEPEIFSIKNYPNPVRTYTKFVVEHDRPESVLNAQVDIYDLSGRQIWTFKQSTLDEINWDVSDMTGRRLSTGVYLYRISIQTNSKVVRSGMNKLIVVE